MFSNLFWKGLWNVFSFSFKLLQGSKDALLLNHVKWEEPLEI